MSNNNVADSVKSQAGSALWDNHANMYEQVFERSTVLWGRDALLLGGLTNGRATKAATQSLRLLDVACGTGNFALHAAEMGFQVTATDYSSGMIERVKHKMLESDAKNIDARVVDGHTLEGIADSSLDVVSSNFGIFMFPDRVAAWQSAKRVLTPGGTLVAASWRANSNNMGMIKYVAANSVNKPGIEDKPSTGSQPSLPTNRTFAAASFQEELEEAGFVDVIIHTVTHAMTLRSGEELVTAILSNGAIATLVGNKEPDSVKLAGLDFCQMLVDGVDPFAVDAEGSHSFSDKANGRRPEDHPLWSRPFVMESTGLIAVARKPEP